MSYTTENTYVSNGSTVLYSFTFPYINEADVKVSLNQLDTTAFTLANATTVELDTAPNSGVSIRIYRSTPTNAVSSVFFPGSAIRAQDLNGNFEQSLFVVQENQAIIENSDAASVTATANEALVIANQANNTSNSISGTATSALTLANAAEATANAADVNASTAQSTALAAQATANSIEATAVAAQSSADAAQATANAAVAPTGSVTMFAGSTVPTGYLECNGQAAPSALAAVLGQANVPDLRGQFVRGWANDRTDLDAGRVLLDTQGDSFKRHRHGIGAYIFQDGTNRTNEIISDDDRGTNLNTMQTEYEPSSASDGTETRPTNVALMYIIKT